MIHDRTFLELMDHLFAVTKERNDLEKEVGTLHLALGGATHRYCELERINDPSQHICGAEFVKNITTDTGSINVCTKCSGSWFQKPRDRNKEF